MGIPSWAVEALMRSVGSMVDRVPPERIDHLKQNLKQRAGQWLDELPQTAARGVDTMFRGVRVSKERLDRWARRHVALVTPVINASGTLADDRLQGVPLGDQAIDLVAESLAAPALRTPVAQQRLQRRLQHCLGREDLGILVASSVDAACLAVGLARQGRPMYIHRSQTVRLPSGTPIPDAFSPSGASSVAHDRVREVGSVDGVAASDRAPASSDALLIAVDGGAANPLWFAPDLAGEVPATQTRILVMTACGGIAGDDAAGPWQTATTPHLRGALSLLDARRSAASVDLVITTGDALLGGPRCGVIIGRAAEIAAIANSQAWPSLEASIPTRAMLAQTLETLHSGSPESLPVIAMLRTSEENLRSRAERLATRVSGHEVIQSCQVTAEPATLVPGGPWRIGSRQLRLRHRDQSAAQWAQQLAEDVPAVLAGVDDEFLVVDLRWVQPSDDASLAAALLGETAAAQEPHEPQEPEQTAPQPNEPQQNDPQPEHPPVQAELASPAPSPPATDDSDVSANPRATDPPSL